MRKKPEEELNHLFDLYDEIRKAEIRNDHINVKIILSEALADSCLFLTRLVNDLVEKKEPKELSELTANLSVAKKLKNKPLLEAFIEAEGKLLEMVELKRPLIEELLSAIRFLYSKELPPVNWHNNLKVLQEKVCHEAKAYSESLQQRKYIKRTIVAGGGVVLGAINLFSPNITPEFKELSTNTGAFLIGTSFDFMKDYLDKP